MNSSSAPLSKKISQDPPHEIVSPLKIDTVAERSDRVNDAQEDYAYQQALHQHILPPLASRVPPFA